MSREFRLPAWLVFSFFLPGMMAAGQPSSAHKLDEQFRAAVADYEGGRYPEAATTLRSLLLQAPQSFDVHELLGLVYAAQSLDAQAVEQLQKAVGLKPASGAARTNLATSLLHSGNAKAAGEQFRKAVELAPDEYDPNHNLGEFYVQEGKLAEARPYLEQAQRLKPSYDNGYDLAQDYFLTGRLSEARELIHKLIAEKDTAELHNLLGQVEEKDGKFVQAATEFQTAAHMEPSDDNLFTWGSEFLLHRTYEPAIDVFQQATKLYPNSPRLLIGLGMALYSRGKYDEAVKALLKAADLDPSDPRCYLFLSKAYDSSPQQADDVIERFRRYAELQPGNAQALYYYAMSLWKGKRAEDTGLDLPAVISLLQKAVALDATLPQPHVQLGNIYADQHEYAKSVEEYSRALALNDNLPDAHYRLAQDYVHLGQKERAQEQFETYQRLRAQYMAEIDKERAEVQQFVYAAKAPAASKP